MTSKRKKKLTNPGRFPQVSNIEFEFDPAREPGKRITYVKLGGVPLDLEKKYRVVTRGYMARGKGLARIYLHLPDSAKRLTPI